MFSKSQIDRLGERLKTGIVAEDDLRMLDEHRRSFIDAYEHVVGRIKTELGLSPTGRPAKSTTSLREKLQRETARLSQIQDVAGCRLVVADIDRQDSVVGQLSALFPDCNIIDRRQKPSFGYRAVHVVVKYVGKLIEIQVRTEVQHRWAELSEKFADRLGSAIKYGQGDETVLNLLGELSRIIGDIEAQENPETANSLAGDFVRRARKRLAELIAETATVLDRKD
jgi:ppGpp synthetase/RelA/SpoT-type nucleotidyltranferase